MKKKCMKFKECQRGEVMLEASMILLTVLIMLMALLSLSFMFYQEAMMTSIANEIASDVAKNYKYTGTGVSGSDHPIGDNSISLDAVEGVGMFRMSFGMNGVESAQEDRASEYVAWRIPLATLGLDSNITNVECEIEGSGIGRAYVRVEVSQTTDFFLSGALEALGVTSNLRNFNAVAYAECVDLTGYTSMINFAEDFSKRLAVFGPVGDLYVSIKDFIANVSDW